MTTSALRTILHDLYAIDPALQSREAELIPLIETLLRERPDATPSEEFVQRLRTMLQERAAALGRVRETPSGFFASIFAVKFSSAILGALIGVALATPTTMLFLRKTLPSAPTAEKSAVRQDGTAAVEEAEPQAFGALNAPAVADRAREKALGLGGGMDADSVAAPSPLIAPWQGQAFTYVYDGDALALTEETVSVLRRTPSALSPIDASRLNLSNIDIGSFPDATVTSLSIAQNRERGFIVSVDAQEGTVSVFQDYEQWPDPLRDCGDDPSCFERLQLSRGDLPADGELLAIAARFLKDHGIALDGYGEPTVDHGWEKQPEGTGNVPDTLQVLYPLTVDGLPVFEQSGGPVGIAVSVSARLKAVTGAWNIQTLAFDRSAYPAVTDSADILAKLAEISGTAPEDDAAKGATVHLGTPERGYIRYYRATGEGRTEQLFVPGLIFPVVKSENTPEWWVPQPVSVPLAKELLAEPQAGPAIPFME